MWKSLDKENTPPLERRGLRAITPPNDNERRILSTEDVCSYLKIKILNII